MPPKEVKKIADKLTDSEKKKIKQENKAKANPTQAAAKKEKSDAKRERRKVSSSQSPPLPPHHSPATGHHGTSPYPTPFSPLAVRRSRAAPRASHDLVLPPSRAASFLLCSV